MTMRKKRQPVTCACGVSYIPHSSRSRFCPECIAMRRVFKARWDSRKNKGYPVPTPRDEYAEAEYRKYLQSEKRRVSVRPEKTGFRCLYCGAELRTAGRYCKWCVQHGFHWVHQVTGRTRSASGAPLFPDKY